MTHVKSEITVTRVIIFNLLGSLENIWETPMNNTPIKIRNGTSFEVIMEEIKAGLKISRKIVRKERAIKNMPADRNIIAKRDACQFDSSDNLSKCLRFNMGHLTSYNFHLKLPTLFLIRSINVVPAQMPMMAKNPL